MNVSPHLPRPLTLLLIGFLLCTCGSATSDAGQEADARAAAPQTAGAVNYPSIPLDRLEYVFKESTYMDATFYDLPVSINQSERAQIQSTIGGISKEPMDLYPTCKPMGHIWFQVEGNNVEEADIYFAENCVGYVWYDNGQPTYSNRLTKEGANFYFNIIQSVQNKAGQ